MENSEKALKIRVVLVTLIVLTSLKFLDWVIFQKAYLQIPNEMEWDTSPWYNFLHYRESIPTDPGRDRVLILGSSVALYSVLPRELDVRHAGKVLDDIHLYSHVAMSPTDIYYYKDHIASKNPKMIVYVMNPADLQLEFVEEVDGKFSYNDVEWLRHFSWRHPARIFYPTEFSLDYFSGLSKAEIYRLWGKSILYVNRYREFIWDPIDSYIERHFRSGRSYHIYTGSLPLEGIWQHGWTRKKATLSCDLREGKREESVYVPLPSTKLTIRYGNGESDEKIFSKSGWHTIQLNSSSHDSRIQLEVDKTYSSKFADNKPYGREYPYGIRLSQNFCNDNRDSNFSYKRPNFLEESRFDEMSIQEYILDYEERIYKDAEIRPELTRMKAISEAKVILNQQEFSPWVEIERIEGIRKFFEERGIRFLLVLSPENPLELRKYKKSEWYQGFLDYLGDRTEGHFFDTSESLEDPRSFSDPHHLTYKGALKFTKILAEIIQEELTHGD